MNWYSLQNLLFKANKDEKILKPRAKYLFELLHEKDVKDTFPNVEIVPLKYLALMMKTVRKNVLFQSEIE